MSRKVILFFAISFLCILLIFRFFGVEGLFLRSSVRIVDTVEGNELFVSADKSRYQQNFRLSIEKYQEVISSQECRLTDSLYAANQIAYCHLMLYEADAAAHWIERFQNMTRSEDTISLSLAADRHFNLGKYHYLKANWDLALKNSHEALRCYLKLGYAGHLKIGQALTNIGLVHRNDGALSDSLLFYAAQAHDVFLQSPELTSYSWECDYLQASLGWLGRWHDGGMTFCDIALGKLESLPSRNSLLESLCWHTKGNLLKKKADKGKLSGLSESEADSMYEISDGVLFPKAIALARSVNSTWEQKYFNSLIINATRFKGDDRVFRYFRELDEVLKQQPNYYGYSNRLFGYYYQSIGDLPRTIEAYSAFLKLNEENPGIDYDLLDEAYYYLRESNKALGNFSESISYALKGLLLYNCCQEDVDLQNESALAQLDTTSTPCLNKYGLLANVLLEKYNREGETKDLYLALSYYELYATHYYERLRSLDEEAFLTTQLDKGNRIFTAALNASYQAWQLTGEDKWLETAFRYMEKMKAYLLFRDRAEIGGREDDGLTFWDSLRVFQGRVNQLEQLIASENAGKEIYDEWQFCKGVQAKLRLRQEQMANEREERILQNRLPSVFYLQRELDDGQGVIEYKKGLDAYYGFYLDRERMQFFRVGGIDFVESLIKTYHGSLVPGTVNGEKLDAYSSSAAELFRILIKPVWKKEDNVQRLLVIPDGPLSRIPFGAFLESPVEKTNQWKIGDYPYLNNSVIISYSPSWKIFGQGSLVTNVLSNTSPIKVGYWSNPEFSSTNGLSNLSTYIGELPNMEISSYINWKGGKDHFLKNFNKFDILNLTLHARSSEQDLYDSRIYFGAQDQQEEILHGYELSRFVAENAPLVVLAACETASGKISRVEGPFNVARSLQQIGFNQIIAGLGRIPAKSTGLVLERFYAHIAIGLTPDKALHLAKKEFVKDSGNLEKFPAFWAGVIYIN